MTLEDKDMERLLEKYYSGQSSEQEELILRASIEQGELTNHTTLKTQLESMKLMRNEPGLDASFDDRIMKELHVRSPKIIRKSNLIYSISGVAASIAAVLVLWFGTGVFDPPAVYGTVNDPVIAFQETRSALDEVSSKLNEGLKPAKKSVQTLDKNIKKAASIKTIDNALNKAKKINKVDQTSDFLKSINKVYVDLGNS